MNNREAVKIIVLSWAKAQREDRGDLFATEKELAAIETDPLGWLEMLRGEDAFQVLRAAVTK